MEIVDAHHHLWDTNHLHYALLDRIPDIRRPFTVAEFEPIARRNGVVCSVCVEAASAGADGLAETHWLLEQARRSAVVARIVAWAPLERPDLPSYLDRLADLDERGAIAGVRRSFEFEAPDFPRRDEVIAGVKAAARRGLSVDLVLFPPSLPATRDLVHACPEVPFVLDHLGKPPVRQGLRHPWEELIAEIAAHPNVACKVSGLTTEADHRAWTAPDLKPYVDHVVRCFGWDRVMFGSDWPVGRLAGTYDRWLGTLDGLTADVPDDARRMLFAANARRIYRLDAADASNGEEAPLPQ